MTIHPPDAVVAARSFPRRWRTVFAMAAGDDAPDLLQRSGALELAGRAADALSSAATALEGQGDHGGEAPDRIDASASALAEAIEGVAPDDWTPERVEAMSTGIDEVAALLRQADAAIQEARADRGG